MQIIIFTLEDKYYAINTDRVDEITKKTSSTIVPNSQDWVEGLLNLRGNVVSLINLFKLLHHQDDMCYNNIIIISMGDEKLGLMVKDIVGVIDIENSDIQKVDERVVDGIIGVIKQENNIINIIDMDALFSENEG